MKAVVDTNVLISGIFFGGIPQRILEAWVDGRFELCLSSSIFDEYVRVCDRIAATRPSLEYRELLASIVGHSNLIPDEVSDTPITADPDNDKFMLCARTAGAIVISGDRHLLDANGWGGVVVRTPRDFLSDLGQ